MHIDQVWIPHTTSAQGPTVSGDLTSRSGDSTGSQILVFGSYSGQSLAVSKSARMLARIIITAVSSTAASTAGMLAYSPIWFGPSKVLQYQEAGEAECIFCDEFEQLCDRLIRALANEPVEDGYTHPGETILEEACSRFPVETAEWAAGAVEGTLAWPHRAATLQLLARLRPLDMTWRTRIIDIGLQSPDVEVRDAAVQAAENWADENLPGLLRAHDEQVVWLKEYIDRVAHDLEG